MKRIYKVTFFFSNACNGKGKIITDFVEGYTKKLVLEKVMRRYGNDVHFPQIKFQRTYNTF